jgi:hypothetical protein
MTEQELENRARAVLEDVLGPEPPNRKVISVWNEIGDYPDSGRTISDHKFSVLGQSADIVVFFDPQGNACGWRDDGRMGNAVPVPHDPETLRGAVVKELGLPEETRLGAVQSRTLPPTGWTWEAVLFARDIPFRVWVDPKSLKIVQCLWGKPAEQ